MTHSDANSAPLIAIARNICRILWIRDWCWIQISYFLHLLQHKTWTQNLCQIISRWLMHGNQNFDLKQERKILLLRFPFSFNPTCPSRKYFGLKRIKESIPNHRLSFKFRFSYHFRSVFKLSWLPSGQLSCPFKLHSSPRLWLWRWLSQR